MLLHSPVFGLDSGAGMSVGLLGLIHVGERVLDAIRSRFSGLDASGCSTSPPRSRSGTQAGRAKLRVAAQWCVLHPATAESGFVTWSDTGSRAWTRQMRLWVGRGRRWWRRSPPNRSPPRSGCAPDRAAAVGRRPGPPTPTPPPVGGGRDAARWRRGRPARSPRPPTTCRRPAPPPWTGSWRTGSARVGGGRSRPRSPRPSPPTTRTCWRPARRAGKAAWGVRLYHRDDGQWAGTSHLDITGDTLRASGIADPLEAHRGSEAEEGALRRVGAPPAPPATRPPTRTSRQPARTALDPDVHHARGPLTGHARHEPRQPTPRHGRPSRPRRPDLDPGTAERLTARRPAHRRGRGRRPVAIRPPPLRSPGTFPTGRLRPLRGRELVILRDQHCIFPWCTRDARACDVDHITPYEENGPPGQTRPDNSPPSADDTTGSRRTDDGATTAPDPAATNGPDPTARPTWSHRRHHVDRSQLILDKLDHRHARYATTNRASGPARMHDCASGTPSPRVSRREHAVPGPESRRPKQKVDG